MNILAEEIEAEAQKILASLRSDELDYIRSKSKRRTSASEPTNTPFACLHDLMDANELLPENAVAWNAVGGPDFTRSNAIMEAFNRLCLRQSCEPPPLKWTVR
jgi:hypothetical protein